VYYNININTKHHHTQGFGHVGVPEDSFTEDMTIGSCWPMSGSSGYITIQLARRIRVDAIAIDHINEQEAININTAPRDFVVYGSSSTMEKTELVSGTYDISADDQNTSQVFDLPTENCVEVEQITLQIESNHGSKEYTCLYRLRVHGEAV